MRGFLTVVLVVFVGLPLLFVPPHPDAGEAWVDCHPAPFTLLGARLEQNPPGYVGGSMRPPFQSGGPAESPLIAAGLANSACLRASLVRLIWALPVIVGLALIPSKVSHVMTERRDAARVRDHATSST